MFRDGPPLFFMLAIVGGIAVVVAMRMALAPLEDEDDGTDQQPAGQQTISFRPLEVAPGHGRACLTDETGIDRARLTKTPELVPNCIAKDAPRRAEVSIRYDVDPEGQPTNISFPETMPKCLASPIRDAVTEWRYCPLYKRGKPDWRYGETATLFFDRSP